MQSARKRSTQVIGDVACAVLVTAGVVACLPFLGALAFVARPLVLLALLAALVWVLVAGPRSVPASRNGRPSR